MPNSSTSTNESAHSRFFREAKRLRRHLIANRIGSVLLGLSGGPDSVLALHLLHEATRDLPGFRLATAHANFNLRGEESRRDERFVKQLLSRYPDVEAHYTSFPTEEYCREKSVSVEMGARQLRHEWFDALCSDHGYARIATGHNAGDNEETLLLNLLRGSGTKGLRGMESDNGRVLRPLLHLSRREVLALLEEVPEKRRTDPLYVTDSSNLTDDYRRNFLRHQILPLLESRWQGTRTALQTTLHLMAEENKIVEAAVAEALASAGELLSWETLRGFPSPLTLIYRWLLPYGCTPAVAAEMESALRGADGTPRPGGRWQLGNHEVTATAAGLRMAASTGDTTDGNNGIFATNPPAIGTESLTPTPETLKSLRHAAPHEAYLPGNIDDYEWRHPLPGERIRISPQATKLITGVLKEAGVTAALRGKAWVLAHRRSGATVWIPGIRRAAESLVKPTDNFICHIFLKNR